MDTPQWPQGVGVVKPMEDSRPMRARPQKDQALNCPRCNSVNTKFCYYNNYNLSQPRYFCKTCRRYWTEGGSLRNVPVGGGSRKNKRSTSSSSSSSTSSPASSSKKLPDHHHLTPPAGFPHSASQNPKIHQGQDLNLSYPPGDQDYNSISKYVEVPFNTDSKTHHQNPSSSSNTSTQLSAMELLKTGITSRGFSSFMPMSVSESSTIYSSTGFPLQEFKPSTLNFSLEGFESGYGNSTLHQGVQESGTGARLLFPIEDLKQIPTTSEFEQNRGQGDHSNGYWNGMMGGGSW
ncbi:hypothetical protein I3843_06G039600 [Carya illinoinensis]|uniref:Dof zinc finger protein n=2 Tax=Carya illinoinensis TaxID=32201 RepID=A0A8T1Q7S6_CARIL|nr:dof zinc finger protein DOF4.6-like [Carya illinoinensis]KAG2701409.1 hypothetical protein I3760_06G043300 [Carya illinoinensis]KAG6650449.1 hypothetical protein CIPAW_06G044400 [Carya illinoinensis]KAG6707682.1 hypothetical protein I3842_06G044000 [Carya illinoinensis]KAG7974258.1 hypothetical protein I3843_06G039600 [Carya illinoinensis]